MFVHIWNHTVPVCMSVCVRFDCTQRTTETAIVTKFPQPVPRCCVSIHLVTHSLLPSLPLPPPAPTPLLPQPTSHQLPFTSGTSKTAFLHSRVPASTFVLIDGGAGFPSDSYTTVGLETMNFSTDIDTGICGHEIAVVESAGQEKGSLK